MESLKVMEKFDGGNFHLWKFKMHMIFSKHGLWKFVDGSATILNDEGEMEDYNEKATKAFALLCEHFINAQLACIQYCENAKSAWETLCGSSPSKCKKGKTCLSTSTW
jgi:hypothetical protein